MQQFPDKKPGLAKKKTYFVEKIWNAISELKEVDQSVLKKFFGSGLIEKHYNFNINVAENCHPKLHTMRRKSKRDWKQGTVIHFKIWTGKPYVEPTFAFAPVIRCQGTEDCSIVYPSKKSISQFEPFVKIGSKQIPRDSEEMELLAKNDGFDCVEDFFHYFDESWDGEIIHWTSFRYNQTNIKTK